MPIDLLVKFIWLVKFLSHGVVDQACFHATLSLVGTPGLVGGSLVRHALELNLRVVDDLIMVAIVGRLIRLLGFQEAAGEFQARF